MPERIPLTPKGKPPGQARAPGKGTDAKVNPEAWKRLLSDALNKGRAARESVGAATRIDPAGPAAPVATPAAPDTHQKLGDPHLILGAHGGDRRSNKFVPKAHKISWGETTEYLIARLKRDAPSVAEGLARGEYRSVRQAAIAAGIVKVPTPLDQAMRWVKKLDHREREELKAYLEQVRAPPDD
ncbi:MAG: hypothetical protein KJ621_10030 [Proteobacteria bacterium]|nr:hypothetical protein [Pseudomonadota bacterium]MBU1742197.1 hypothetical protein [Pseudomonadota bacterium]